MFKGQFYDLDEKGITSVLILCQSSLFLFFRQNGKP